MLFAKFNSECTHSSHTSWNNVAKAINANEKQLWLFTMCAMKHWAIFFCKTSGIQSTSKENQTSNSLITAKNRNLNQWIVYSCCGSLSKSGLRKVWVHAPFVPQCYTPVMKFRSILWAGKSLRSSCHDNAYHHRFHISTVVLITATNCRGT